MSEDLKYGSLYQHLVHNDEVIRQSAMRKLRHFISSKESQDDDEDEEENEPGLSTVEMAKMWRGLFYCFWMSDKDDIQQDFARNLASSIHLWRPYTALTFFNAFLETMADRWSTIDHHRMNKYLSLIRRMVEAMFIYLRVYDWDLDIVNQFSEVISYTLRQLTGTRRGLGMELLRLYLKSLAASMNSDVYFNDINIDALIAENEYDDNTSLEDIYYNQYVWRKNQRTGQEAVERFHAKKAAKREGAAPLDFKFTKRGRKEARLAAGRPTNPENGRLLYTNPIAYLLNRKVKKEKTADTPDIPVEIFNASRENILTIPDTAVVSLLDVMLNCYKFKSDKAVFELLQDHFRNFWFTVVTRFIDDAEATMNERENPHTETPDDVLGHTAAASLRSMAIFVREKATSVENLNINTKTGKVQQVNLASLSLSQYPATTSTRRVYNNIADQLERFIARLIDLGVDFDDLEARDAMPDFGGEGEDGFDPSMMMCGEGEDGFGSSWGEEGELDDAELARYLAAMNGEGEFADDFDEFEGDLDDEQEFDEDGEPIFNPNGPFGDDNDDDDLGFDFGEGEDNFSFGEEDEDDFDFGGEGEADDFFMGGEGEDDLEISTPLLLSLFGPSLKFDKRNEPVLTQPMMMHLCRYLDQRKMKLEADSAQSPITKKNTKENVKLAASYVPDGPAKWNYGYEDPLSDEDDDMVKRAGKRKAIAQVADLTKKQKTTDHKKSDSDIVLKKNHPPQPQPLAKNTKKGSHEQPHTSPKSKVNFDIANNKVQTFTSSDQVKIAAAAPHAKKQQQVTTTQPQGQKKRK